MGAGGRAIDQTQRQDSSWKWLLPALCALAAFWIASSTIDNFGLGSRPWWGYWDGGFVSTAGRPYVVTAYALQPGGALERAGIRDGDRLDYREQTLEARVALFAQPLATRPTTLTIHRGTSAFTARFVGSTIWEGGVLLKVLPNVLIVVKGLCLLICAVLIAIRRWWLRDARMLALILLCLVPGGLIGPDFVVPSPAANVLLWAVQQDAALAALVLLVALSARYGTRYAWRRILESCAYGAIGLVALALTAGYVGVFTLRFDPLAFWWYTSVVARILPGITLAVLVLAAVAVACSSRSERPRAAWLLLPLPIALVASEASVVLAPYAQSWAAGMALDTLSTAFALSGALFVTYALLSRRVVDVGFIVSRTIVVAIVSLIVVLAFILLEWVLGTAVAGVSHATGLVANAALALALGLSLRLIHKRVDDFVDAVMFRKRHDDERALRDFAKEAAFVTERSALLDEAVGKLREHTDAQAAALLVRSNGTYEAVRRFGEAPAATGENDPAILALKTWHKPLDPHRYATELHGDLALPMVSRGRLLGVLLCGERIGGEAYAPDEVEALSEFAHGVGSALDTFENGHDLRERDEMITAINALRESIELLIARSSR